MMRATETLGSLDQPPAVRRASWLAALPAGADLRTAAAGAPNTQASANAEPSGDTRLVPQSSAPARITGKTASALLEQALRASAAFPPPVFRWLQDALQAYAKEGHAGTLERHLGLRIEQHKGRSAVRRRVVENRWNALGAAYRAQLDCQDMAPLKRCAILVADIAEFKKAFWSTWCSKGPPESPSQLRQALFNVHVLYDGAPPQSVNSIYRALQQAEIIGPASDSHE